MKPLFGGQTVVLKGHAHISLLGGTNINLLSLKSFANSNKEKNLTSKYSQLEIKNFQSHRTVYSM